MRDSTALCKNTDLANEAIVHHQLDFSTIYDRYAPALLGVILRIISDKALADSLLEATFKKVYSEMDHFKPSKQPMFAWLLNIARCTALEERNKRRQLARPSIQLTTAGKVVPLPINATHEPVGFIDATTSPQDDKLIDLILFKNCTPEEAAVLVGLPVEIVRQQLRLAVQQLRIANKQSNAQLAYLNSPVQ